MYTYIYIYTLCLFIDMMYAKRPCTPPGYSSLSCVCRCFLPPGELLKSGVWISVCVPRYSSSSSSSSSSSTITTTTIRGRVRRLAGLGAPPVERRPGCPRKIVLLLLLLSLWLLFVIVVCFIIISVIIIVSY